MIEIKEIFEIERLPVVGPEIFYKIDLDLINTATRPARQKKSKKKVKGKKQKVESIVAVLECVKVKYRNYNRAVKAIEKINSLKIPHMRELTKVYQCTRCKFWHTSSIKNSIMPTKEQLDISLESQLEFPETRHDYVSKPLSFTEFTGEVIGYYQYDKETDDFKLIITKEANE